MNARKQLLEKARTMNVFFQLIFEKKKCGKSYLAVCCVKPCVGVGRMTSPVSPPGLGAGDEHLRLHQPHRAAGGAGALAGQHAGEHVAQAPRDHVQDQLEVPRAGAVCSLPSLSSFVYPKVELSGCCLLCRPRRQWCLSGNFKLHYFNEASSS